MLESGPKYKILNNNQVLTLRINVIKIRKVNECWENKGTRHIKFKTLTCTANLNVSDMIRLFGSRENVNTDLTKHLKEGCVRMFDNLS